MYMHSDLLAILIQQVHEISIQAFNRLTAIFIQQVHVFQFRHSTG